MTLRIDHITAEADKFGSGKDGFSGGEVSTQTPATVITADWLNSTQEAICQAIEGKGITLAADTHGQLLRAIREPVVITTSTLGSNQNNFNPTGFATSDFVRIALSADVSITGFDATAKHPRIIYNSSGTYKVTLPNDSGSSTAGNRVVTQDNSTSLVIQPRTAVYLAYDTVTSNWRPFYYFDTNLAQTFGADVTLASGISLRLSATGEVTYAATRSVTKLLHLGEGWALNLPTGYGADNNGTLTTPTDGEYWLVPVKLPHGSIIKTLRAGYTVTGTPGAGNEPLLEVLRTNPDLNTGGYAVLTTLDTATGSAAAGTALLNSATLSVAVDNDSYTYLVQLKSAAGGATATQWNWLEITFTDVGLSNK